LNSCDSSFKFEFPTFRVSSNGLHTFKIIGNRLHVLVIDYMCLGWLWNPLFWGNAWSWTNLEARLCLLKQSYINLETNVSCLILLWHHQNHVYIHSHSPHFLWWQWSDFFLTSSKHTWFTFFPSLTLTLIIKQILFDIIKACMIYIFSLFEMTNTCRLGATKKKSIFIVYFSFVLQWLLIWDNWRFNRFHI